MNDKETEAETVKSERVVDRRRLFCRLLTLAGLGVTGVLLSQDKTGLIPQVDASTGSYNDNTGGPALMVEETRDPGQGTGNTYPGLEAEGSPAIYAGAYYPYSEALVVQGDLGQTANLQVWQASQSGYPLPPPKTLSVVDANGKLGIGTATPAAGVDVNVSGVDPIHARGTPGAGIPNSFIVQNLTAGNAKSQFTFRDSTGANRYSFGNDAAGNNGQNFFIVDEVSGKIPLQIDSSDSVHTLDLVFANGVRATEDGGGLAFKNEEGQKIALLDKQGNLHIKGRLISDL